MVARSQPPKAGAHGGTLRRWNEGEEYEGFFPLQVFSIHATLRFKYLVWYDRCVAFLGVTTDVLHGLRSGHRRKGRTLRIMWF